MILQLKTGKLDAGYFRDKFGVEILDEWNDVWRQYVADELLEIDGDEIRLTRTGLLQADALLPAFFEPEHRTCGTPNLVGPPTAFAHGGSTLS